MELNNFLECIMLKRVGGKVHAKVKLFTMLLLKPMAIDQMPFNSYFI